MKNKTESLMGIPVEVRNDCPKDVIVVEQGGKPVGAIVNLGIPKIGYKEFRELMLMPLPREF
jgi:hypothetical protein